MPPKHNIEVGKNITEVTVVLETKVKDVESHSDKSVLDYHNEETKPLTT